MSDHFVTFEQARILVADDDPILREFATVHLATPSVEVEVAADGVEALEKLQAEAQGGGGFDLALVDLDMPRMDGFELIRRVRADDVLRHLPLVVVTGREDMMAVDRAYAEGATSFVVKPLNWRVLSHQLAYVLRNCRVEAGLRQQLAAAVAKAEPRQNVSHGRIMQDTLTAIAAAARRIEAATGEDQARDRSRDIIRLSEAASRLHRA